MGTRSDLSEAVRIFCTGFDDQQWYQQLYDYGMTASFGAGDADEELIPRLVKELVQPLAQHALQDVWSPASRRQSRAAAALVADLLVYVPADDGKMQARSGSTCSLSALSKAAPTVPGLDQADLLILATAYVQLACICFSSRLQSHPSSAQ